MRCSDPECGHLRREHYEPEELGPFINGRHPCSKCGCYDFVRKGETRPEGQGKSVTVNQVFENGVLVRDRVTVEYGKPFRPDDKCVIRSLEEFDNFVARHPKPEYVLVQGASFPLMDVIRTRETVEYTDSFPEKVVESVVQRLNELK